MKPNIDTLKSTFDLSQNAYAKSKAETQQVWEMFHNEYYTADQKQAICDAGLAEETFNIVKMISRLLTGLYSTMYNTIRVIPSHPENMPQSNVLNSVIRYVDNENHVTALNDKLRLECIISGLMIQEVTVRPKVTASGDIERDIVGRVVYDIEKEVLSSNEVALDPMSRRIDYLDARFIHVYKWVTGEYMDELFGKRKVNKLRSQDENIGNSTTVENPIDTQTSWDDHENYLLVHTYMRDGDTIWSVWWSGDTILRKDTVEGSYGRFPITVTKLQEPMGGTNKPEYYGIFREAIGSIQALHQALLQIQLHVNSNKVIVRTGAIPKEEWGDFKKSVVRVNSIIELDNPDDIKILNMDRDIQQQYIIADRLLDRIQKVLGINDSFFGQAYASDSGRKVKLQQNQTLMALRYIDSKMKLHLELVGKDTLHLVREFFSAYRVLRITNPQQADEWVEINKPLLNPITGKVVTEIEIDEDGMPVVDKHGTLLETVYNHHHTDVSFASTDFELVTVMFNDDDEKSQLMMETILSGNIGMSLNQASPDRYMRASALAMRNMKTKHADDIANLLLDTADELEASKHQQMPQQQMPQQRGSQTMKLPQNTNEGV